MTINVLLIEDDITIAQSIQVALEEKEMRCDIADFGEEGLEISKLYTYHIIVLDLLLPDIEGYEVLRRLRAAKIKLPVLILSGLNTVEHKIRGLSQGADDYLTKPFDIRELAVRIEALVRRSEGHSESVVRFDKVAINFDTREVEVDSKKIHLTPKEFKILHLLARRKGTVLTKEHFLRDMYGHIDEPQIKIIDVFICKLRKKLADASGGINYIETVWGRGYMLKGYENESESAINSPELMTVGG